MTPGADVYAVIWSILLQALIVAGLAMRLSWLKRSVLEPLPHLLLGLVILMSQWILYFNLKYIYFLAILLSLGHVTYLIVKIKRQNEAA